MCHRSERLYPTIFERLFSGHVIIKFLDPVPTDGLTDEDIPKLTERVYEAMQAEYIKLTEEVLDALPSDYPLAVQQTRS